MVKHEVNYYCDGQPQNGAELQVCPDDELRVNLLCILCGYVPMVFKPTAWASLAAPFRKLTGQTAHNDPVYPHDIHDLHFLTLPWGVYSRLRNAFSAVRYMIRWPAHQLSLIWAAAEGFEYLCGIVSTASTFGLIEALDDDSWIVHLRNDFCSMLYFPACTAMEQHYVRAFDGPVAGAPPGRPARDCFECVDGEGNCPDAPGGESGVLTKVRAELDFFFWGGGTQRILAETAAAARSTPSAGTRW